MRSEANGWTFCRAGGTDVSKREKGAFSHSVEQVTPD